MKLKILIIEDDDVDKKVLIRMLNSVDVVGNNSILAASSLEAGISILTENSVDIIICDLGLTDAFGPEILERVQEVSPHTPIVVASNDHREDTLMEAFKYGAEDFLCKDDITAMGLKRCLKNAIERRKLKNSLLELTHKAEIASTAKSRFLANMSHEIRTPLNLIIGVSDLLRETRLTPQQKRYVDVFEKAGSHLLTIINNVLDISKIENGDFAFEKCDFCLELETDKVAEIAALSCRSKKLLFDYYFSCEVPQVFCGDAGRIKQVLLNLINNSVKYTEKGVIKLFVKNVDSKIQFVVEDTGSGIPPDKKDKVFESFYQIVRKSAKSGTGLGLSIAKELATRMGGDLYLDTAYENGSRFVFELPITTETQVLEPLPLPNLSRSTHVVAMATTEGKCQILREVVEQMGARVDVINSGKSTVDLLNSLPAPPDYLILDLHMNDFGGFQIIESIQYSLDQTKIIFLVPSIHRNGDIENIGRISNAEFVYKPINRSKIRNIFLEKKQCQKNSLDSQKPIKILVAEDDVDNQLLIKEYLRPYNHEIIFAKNGREAVRFFEEGRSCDMVLMDIQMPIMDGYEATQKIREYEVSSGRQRPIPLYGLSANAFSEEVKKALSKGFTGYMTKPIRKVELVKLISGIK